MPHVFHSSICFISGGPSRHNRWTLLLPDGNVQLNLVGMSHSNGCEDWRRAFAGTILQAAHGKTWKKIWPGAWKWAGLRSPNTNWQQCHVVCWDSEVKILNPILVTTARWEQVSKSTNKNRHMEITKSKVTLSCYQLWLLVGFLNPASCWSFISMSASPSSHGLSSLLAKSWHCRTSWLLITKVEGGQQRLKGDSKERCHHDAICTTWRHGNVVLVEFAIHELSEMICLRLIL